MRKRTLVAVAAIALALGVATGVWAQAKVKFFTGSGLKGLDFLGYTYRNVIDGYPPMPRIEYILGADSKEYAQIPYGYKYECIVDAIQHEVGYAYNWRMQKYKDATKKEVEPTIWTSGTSTAY